MGLFCKAVDDRDNAEDHDNQRDVIHNFPPLYTVTALRRSTPHYSLIESSRNTSRLSFPSKIPPRRVKSPPQNANIAKSDTYKRHYRTCFYPSPYRGHISTPN